MSSVDALSRIYQFASDWAPSYPPTYLFCHYGLILVYNMSVPFVPIGHADNICGLRRVLLIYPRICTTWNYFMPLVAVAYDEQTVDMLP